MNKPLTVWLLQTGEPLHCDVGNPRPMRAMNLANALVDAGHQVVLWSSAFYHQEKSHRSRAASSIAVSPRLEIRLIPSPGYARNIGPGRLWDHALLGWRLARWLDREPAAPDVTFVGYPPIETAAVMARWLKRRGVPCLVDVKDQWPAIFTRPLPRALQGLGEIALWPYFYLGRRAMRDATGIVAMADGFLQWAREFAGRAPTDADRVVALTTPDVRVPEAELDAAAQWWDAQGVVADGRTRMFFVGSHSQAFDMHAVAQAASELDARGVACEFVLCGDGDCSAQWRSLMAKHARVVFPGWVNRAQIEALAQRSTAALAPYHSTDDFMRSVPNKVIDALALGLPVLSPLRGEVAKLIDGAQVGLGYGAPGGATLAECVARLREQPALRQALAANALRLYGERFSFDKVYGGLVAHLETLARRPAPAAGRDAR